MNIFAVHDNPSAAAQHLCDAHVNKMILETAQIMSTVHALHDEHEDWMYKPTHKHHPSVLWAAENNCNYGWLWYHWRALSAEFMLRFKKEHASWKKLGSRLEFPPTSITHNPKQTPFALAMPDQYKFFDSPVDCYRAYYAAEKSTQPWFRYTNAHAPDWLAEWQERLN
jgi:hypothetical protein